MLVGVDLAADAVEQGAGLGVDAGPAARLAEAAEEDVLPDRHRVHQVQFLVDDGQPHVHRLDRRDLVDRPPLEDDLPAVLLVHPGQDLHQRRLAGPVLADDPVDDAAG